MTFGTAISTCFSKYATFEGRASRSEYWLFTLFNSLVGVGLNILAAVMATEEGAGLIGVLSIIYSLVTFLPCMAAIVRRLHDIGKSGAYYWIILIPIVGWIVILVFLIKESDPGKNQYGTLDS